MTNWNLSFDYAACFLMLLIIIWYFTEKRIPLKSYGAFLCLAATIFSAAGFEVLATQMARNMDTVGFNSFFAVLSLQTMAVNMVPLAFMYYILILGQVDLLGKRGLKIALVSIVVLDAVIIITNFASKWAFTFENGRYITRLGLYIMYGMDLLMVLVSVITMIRNGKTFVFLRSPALIFNVVCSLIATVLQIVIYVPTLNFMLAALALTLYYYMQNPGMITDPVTRQFNRKFMGEYVQSRFVSGKKFGVIALAMDDFKFINKTYGVDNGDNLLLQIGGFLNSLKASKEVFRFGSDQFCVVVNKNPEDIDRIAGFIHDRFKHPWYSETQYGIMMSASVCCIECPRDAENYGELIEVLDYAMSVAKKTSKGKVTLAKNLDLDKIKQDKAVEKAVKQAMDRDELMVYYQPIFSVSKGAYNSAEALVRLHDETLGWISPEIFIPIAEKNGLIIEMGEMILKKVCRFIHDFKLSETTVEYIEVNISPVQLMQLNFADRVKQIMEEYDVRPEQINIEITETATMSSASIVNENIGKLVDYGISFSLDDYGSGYANIDYINKMPFKIIKLDKFIIWDAFKNSKAGITLEYTIGMLNALQLYIVAEGVETEEMQEHLTRIGCHYMQGWYYSKAVADTEFMKLIASQ
ncbi:MAG: putative bifunctional diguanylate cyclase/phosphodiesterase [Wujia sp.]